MGASSNVKGIICQMSQLTLLSLSETKFKNGMKLVLEYQIFLILWFLGVKLMIVAKPQIPTNIPYNDQLYEC